MGGMTMIKRMNVEEASSRIEREPYNECTVGAVMLKEGLLVFKNRDLNARYVVNKRIVFEGTPETHVLRGFDLKTESIAGVSIGVNRRGVCVANTHVVSEGDVAYDLLCEELLCKVDNRSDVEEVVQAFLGVNIVQGGRIVVCGLSWICLVEVFRQTFRVQDCKESILITNGFSMISHAEVGIPPADESSETREKVGNMMIGSVSGIRDVKRLLRSHVPEMSDLSICRHGAKRRTESSHIIQVNRHKTEWAFLVGNPCENDYSTMEVFDCGISEGS